MSHHYVTKTVQLFSNLWHMAKTHDKDIYLQINHILGKIVFLNVI